MIYLHFRYQLISDKIYQLPYSRKIWYWENVANLVDHSWFAKPNQFLQLIIFWLIYSFSEAFFHQMLEESKFTKFSHYIKISTLKKIY